MTKYDPDEFFHHKQTNADRIRAMTDEELAGVFWALLNESIFVCPFETPNDLLSWLKAPVEVNT